MKLKSLVMALAASVAAAGTVSAQQITGAGATFPAPVYAKWAEGARSGANIELNYQAIGSGGGINQITNRTVDFGASDAPLAGDKLASGKLLQFPTVMGAVVPIVNIPGVEPDQLKLTGELLADLYLGKITKWNDPRLVEANRGVSLPNLAVAPVYRADGSGTTFVFASYLSAVSSDWKGKVGAATSIRWPVGTGARGNDGVAATVRNTRGAVGYVEYAYAHVNKLTTAQLRNKAGNYVRASSETFAAAASSADWTGAQNFAVDLIDQAGAQAWPIVSATFILLPTNPTDAARSRNVMRFFDWAYTNGGAAAEELDYIPLPANVQDAVRAAWQKNLVADGKPIWSR